MLYLIGLGLNEKGISIEGIEFLMKCSKIYLEFYTVDFPYRIKNLEKTLREKIILLERQDVESDKLIKEAKKENIALLVYGSALFATTHISLVEDCRKAKVKVEIIFSASVFDAISKTGLQLYKFGKISSMPKFQKNFEPDSFLDTVKQNQSINAHSLILIDIKLDFPIALEQLEKTCENKKMKMDKILVCSRLGTKNEKIFYGEIEKLKNKKIPAPYCIIIPSELHFMEKESVKRFGW